ncbi:MAG: formylglycine-generating enzyme family protein [Leptolyngbyaceae cyanobacterium MO_188.B28]|nr:formylglycine-generating enzyme family protein [Leptolyngbyaceae cyanobacterium MO_188.B28]
MASTQERQPKVTIHKSQGQNPCFDEILAGGVSLRMMLIPSGRFLMGSPKSELERMAREGPQHSVNVPAFCIGKYSVTQIQWRVVAETPQVNRALEVDPSGFKGDQHPVESVSWEEAVEFCDRLSAHTNRSYRLPTEIEWEYACRAGSSTPFHFGPTISPAVANYRGNHKAYRFDINALKGAYRETTVSVDHFGLANEFGLCDMHGNVWEWCQNQWRKNYTDNLDEDSDRVLLNQEQSLERIARGGSWLSTAEKCRAASRFHFPPTARHNDLGFRVVCFLSDLS